MHLVGFLLILNYVARKHDPETDVSSTGYTAQNHTPHTGYNCLHAVLPYEFCTASILPTGITKLRASYKQGAMSNLRREGVKVMPTGATQNKSLSVLHCIYIPKHFAQIGFKHLHLNSTLKNLNSKD